MGGPLFIGILNLTPDSFSDGGRFMDPESALAQARGLRAAGAGMLDLGAESTRPGAAPVDAATEWSRLEPVLSALGETLPGIPLSLDTRHPAVAARGLAAGAVVINDVTGFSDPDMLDLVLDSFCGLIAMRSRREGAGFHMPPYEAPAPKGAEAVIAELRALRDRLRGARIPEGRVLLDPGFGFGTTFPEDLALWEALPDLPAALAWPADRICLGLSRKRFLAARAGTPSLPPDQRDGLTALAHAQALRWGFRIFRTHAIG
ncbi:MAG: dihydropteroate synthase [Geothrix sp.]|nr:dihydropteroate synthase [Geothrix sp.]